MEINKIYNMDCLKGLKPLDDNSIDCCVTSPPYWGLRDYGVEGQLGLEATPEEYVEKLVLIFREVRRTLKPEGTLWLNLGDSYAGGGRNSGNSKPHPKAYKGLEYLGDTVKGKVPEGMKPKDLVGIPWMVAFALRVDGWYLRSDIIWSKPNCMPESVTDRPTKSHEYIFLLSKSQHYYYDNEAIKEPIAESTVNRGPVTFGGAKGRNYKPEKGDPNFRNGSEQWGRTFDYTESCKNGRNKRTVWNISTKPFKGAHFAVFPPKLIEPCILAGCPVGGIVLDPFMGSGTTAMVAVQNQRNYIGYEMNQDYIDIANKRIEGCESQIRLPI
jgi:DNA modification methylase